MATGDLTTLANAKAYIPNAGTADDALLARMITGLSAFVVNWLNRNILTASYTETRDGYDTTRMMTLNYPITAVSAVTVNGSSIPLASGWPQNGYGFDSASIVLMGYSFPRGFRNVTLAYTAGFATVPADIEQAVLEVLALRYKQRDRVGYNSKSLAGETVAFTISDMEKSTITALRAYQMVVPIQ